MELKIDFENKVITVSYTVNLEELFNNIKKLLPDWKEYDLQVENNFIPYYPQPNFPQPTLPEFPPFRYDDSSTVWMYKA